MARTSKSSRRIDFSRCVRIKRAYEPPAPRDGMGVLVDRLRPRGLSKAALSRDVWLKEVAPTSELRKWFGHDPAKWRTFRQRYRAELETNPALRRLLDLIQSVPPGGAVTLVFSASDGTHNQAVVLREFVLEVLESGRGGAA